MTGRGDGNGAQAHWESAVDCSDCRDGAHSHPYAYEICTHVYLRQRTQRTEYLCVAKRSLRCAHASLCMCKKKLRTEKYAYDYRAASHNMGAIDGACIYADTYRLLYCIDWAILSWVMVRMSFTAQPHCEHPNMPRQIWLMVVLR